MNIEMSEFFINNVLASFLFFYLKIDFFSLIQYILIDLAR